MTNDGNIFGSSRCCLKKGLRYCEGVWSAVRLHHRVFYNGNLVYSSTACLFTKSRPFSSRRQDLSNFKFYTTHL